MKASLLLLALAPTAFAAPAIQPRITPEELLKRQQSSPAPKLQQPAEGEAKVNRPEDQSIVKQSTILSDGRNWTLIPKGAVIHMPATEKHRADSRPVGTLLSWTDFLARNYAWLTTNEVSFNQAAGTESIPADRAAFWAKQDKVVVAVHQGGPISVRIASNQESNVTQR